MATTLGEDLRNLNLGGFSLGAGDTLSLKITPGAAASATQAGAASGGGTTGGSGQGLAGSGGVPQGFQSQVPSNQRLSQNPQLVTHPLGAQTDSQYEAAVAQLAHGVNQQYAGVLRDLGFIDESGNFVPGALELAAARQRASLQNQQQLAREQVTNDKLRQGALFSGRRAVLQAQAEQPFVSGLAELESSLAGQLGDRYRQASGLLQGFTLDRNALIAAAAERALQRIVSAPVGETPPPPAPEPTVPSTIPISPNTQRNAVALESNPYLFSGGTREAALQDPRVAARMRLMGL